MLQSFMRVGYFSLQWHMLKEKVFILFNSPDTQSCIFVDIMLIKQAQLKIAGFRLHPLKINFIRAGIYDLFAEYCCPNSPTDEVIATQRCCYKEQKLVS